jgi:hypothetical protein
MGKSSSSDSSSSEDDKKKDKKKDKKEVKKKAKVVMSTPQTYSKRYDSLFNNKKLSDMQVKFEGSGDTYPGHKLVFAAHSEVFEGLVDNLTDNTYIFTKDIDEECAKSLVKFFYTGSLEYTNEAKLVTFMILANKYKVKNLGEFKVPPKVYLNGIIEYVEKDLNNRLGEFDKLAESINFKKIEKEDLTKLYAKKKWLQKSSSFLNIIIMKDMDDDESGSGSGSDKDSDSDSDKSSEEESEDEEEGGGVAVFDPKASHSSWTFDKKTKFFKCNNSSWYTAISKKPHDKFTVELGTGVGTYMSKIIFKISWFYSKNLL